jgi:hypothetical protein
MQLDINGLPLPQGYLSSDNPGIAALNLSGNVDADFANDLDDRRSITGYVFYLANAPITWQCKAQSTVALINDGIGIYGFSLGYSGKLMASYDDRRTRLFGSFTRNHYTKTTKHAKCSPITVDTSRVQNILTTVITSFANEFTREIYA